MTRVGWKIVLLLPGLLLLGVVYLGRAQTSASAYLSPPDRDAFPRITTYLNIQDTQGFVEGLQLGDVRIRENDQPLPASEISLVQPGTRLVVAISPGPSFNIRDVLGNTRYAYLVESLRVWSNLAYQSPSDEFNLVAAGYPEALEISSPKEWFRSFEGYQPDAAEAVPSLDTLSRAVDVAGRETPRAGMGRAVLFITAPQDGETTASLQGIVLDAQQKGIRIYIWLLAASEVLTSPGAIQLSNVAEQTGGTLFAFSDIETFPNIEDLIKPLRSSYAISYDSKIATSGIHQVAVEVNTDEIEVITQSATFDLTVVPPNPIFVSLPAMIKRAVPEEKSSTSADLYASSLAPVALTLDILIEFSDGYPRSIASTSLYVDGALAVKNTSPPYEAFTWDLRPYTQSSKHLLRVEVVDSLGMVGASIDTAVQVDIQLPRRNFLAMLFTWQNALLAGVVVLLAGFIVMLLLVLGGRLSPYRYRTEHQRSMGKIVSRSRAVLRASAPAQKQAQEPSSTHVSGWLGHLQIHKTRPAPKAPAFLTPISEEEDQPAVAPIPIHDHVILFGRDSMKATMVLEDGSVDRLHARLQQEKGVFRLLDAGSIAGTWVNYVPVPTEGTILEHGDCIHIGRVGFRFTLRDLSQVRKPVVRPHPVEMER